MKLTRNAINAAINSFIVTVGDAMCGSIEARTVATGERKSMAGVVVGALVTMYHALPDREAYTQALAVALPDGRTTQKGSIAAYIESHGFNPASVSVYMTHARNAGAWICGGGEYKNKKGEHMGLAGLAAKHSPPKAKGTASTTPVYNVAEFKALCEAHSVEALKYIAGVLRTKAETKTQSVALDAIAVQVATLKYAK